LIAIRQPIPDAEYPFTQLVVRLVVCVRFRQVVNSTRRNGQLVEVRRNRKPIVVRPALL
jgi:hypothetical protein